jgi:hypothetical protein
MKLCGGVGEECVLFSDDASTREFARGMFVYNTNGAFLDEQCIPDERPKYLMLFLEVAFK